MKGDTMVFVDNVEEKEFTKFVSSNNKGHFLQSYEWGEVSNLNGWKSYYVGMKKNGKLVATALLLKKCLPLGYSYFYIPRGYVMDYKDYDLLNEFTKNINIFTKKHKSLFFKIDPDIKLHTIDEEAKVIQGENNYDVVDNLKKIGFKRRSLNKFFEHEQPRYTFRILLDNDENIDKRYSKTVHRFIKKANNYNVHTYIGTRDDINEFVRLMKLTEKRQNFYSHKDSYYEKFYDILNKREEHVIVMLAKVKINDVIEELNKEIENAKNDVSREKKIKEREFYLDKKNKEVVVSAYFTVLYGNKAWYLYGANDLDYRDCYANYKLFDYQIKESKNRGMEIFDEFGTIGDVHTKNKLIGLHEFKKKFGGEYTEFIGEFDYIQKPFMNLLYRLVIPVRRKIVRTKLRKRGE